MADREAFVPVPEPQFPPLFPWSSWWVAGVIYVITGTIIPVAVELICGRDSLPADFADGAIDSAWGLFVGWKVWGEKRGGRRG